MIESLLNHRFAILFASLVFTLTIVPVVRALGVGPDILDVALAINLALAVFATARTRNLLIGAAVTVLFVIVRFASAAEGDRILDGRLRRVVAAADPARSLAAMQAVGGQLYLAVLVARLVGLHAREESR